MNNLTVYDTKDALAEAVADAISSDLREAVAARDTATFVASGGGTPKPAFARLANDDRIDWTKVTVTLSDERVAPPEAGVSNAEMLRTHLLHEHAASAHFTALDSLSALDELSRPFDVVLLGMGGDGHFASIFPGGEGMSAAMAADAPVLVATTPSPLPPEAPYPRLSLSFEAIRTARHVILMISGEGKREVLERAASDDPAGDLPIRRLLRDESLPLSIHWAP